MIRHVLLTLYPRSWRDRYGEEYCALLEDMGITCEVVIDSAKSALMLRLREHAHILSIIVILGQCSFSLWLCVHLRITDNMLWPPTTPLRAAALIATYAPLFCLIRGYLKLSARTE